MSHRKTERLFARFAAIYAGRWTACYATPESVQLGIAEWAEVVESMTEEQLWRAVGWAKISCTWPPSIAEFLHAGLEITEEEIDQVAKGLISYWDRTHMPKHEIDAAMRRNRSLAVRQLVEWRLGPPQLSDEGKTKRIA